MPWRGLGSRQRRSIARARQAVSNTAVVALGVVARVPGVASRVRSAQARHSGPLVAQRVASTMRWDVFGRARSATAGAERNLLFGYQDRRRLRPSSCLITRVLIRPTIPASLSQDVFYSPWVTSATGIVDLLWLSHLIQSSTTHTSKRCRWPYDSPRRSSGRPRGSARSLISSTDASRRPSIGFPASSRERRQSVA